MEKTYEARKKYITWLEENEVMNFKESEDIDAILNNLYEKE